MYIRFQGRVHAAVYMDICATLPPQQNAAGPHKLHTAGDYQPGKCIDQRFWEALPPTREESQRFASRYHKEFGVTPFDRWHIACLPRPGWPQEHYAKAGLILKNINASHCAQACARLSSCHSFLWSKKERACYRCQGKSSESWFRPIDDRDNVYCVKRTRSSPLR